MPANEQSRIIVVSVLVIWFGFAISLMGGASVVEKELSLLTIRHYHDDLLHELSKGKRIRLRQQSPETVQLVMHN